MKIVQMNYRQLEQVRPTGIEEPAPGETPTDLEQQRQQQRQRVHAAPVGKDSTKFAYLRIRLRAYRRRAIRDKGESNRIIILCRVL